MFPTTDEENRGNYYGNALAVHESGVKAATTFKTLSGILACRTVILSIASQYVSIFPTPGALLIGGTKVRDYHLTNVKY